MCGCVFVCVGVCVSVCACARRGEVVLTCLLRQIKSSICKNGALMEKALLLCAQAARERGGWGSGRKKERKKERERKRERERYDSLYSVLTDSVLFSFYPCRQ